ncbi:MAG: hypothetical protein WDZ47_00880 [Bacteroidales bacterium]
MLRRTVILLLIALPLKAVAQDMLLIGMTKEDIKALVKKEHRDFFIDKSIVKKQFNYLKYVNGRQTITWIIYFSDGDICTSTKKVCDYVEYDFVLDVLNDNCRKNGELTWECSSNGQNYIVSLVEQDWYFTVRQRLKE